MILCVYNPKVFDKTLKLQNFALHANICLHATGYPCPVISTFHTYSYYLFFVFYHIWRPVVACHSCNIWFRLKSCIRPISWKILYMFISSNSGDCKTFTFDCTPRWQFLNAALAPSGPNRVFQVGAFWILCQLNVYQRWVNHLVLSSLWWNTTDSFPGSAALSFSLLTKTLCMLEERKSWLSMH